MKKIESAQNIKIKQIQKLRKNHERKKTGLFLIEGKEELRKALKAKIEIEYIILSLDILKTRPQFLNNYQEKIYYVSREFFKKISYRENPEGVLAVAKRQDLKLENLKLKKNSFFVILEKMEKPGNLGAILRSADASGVDALIICDQHTDIYNPNVIRASIGTIFSVPVFVADKEKVLEFLREHKIKTFATSPQAEKIYTKEDLKESLALIVGSEHDGLSDFWLQNADTKIKIPMFGETNSLNASVSTAIILYEIVRQRDENIV